MRIVVGGLMMQFLMALLVLRSDIGQSTKARALYLVTVRS
jgi:hypothetical protein